MFDARVWRHAICGRGLSLFSVSDQINCLVRCRRCVHNTSPGAYRALSHCKDRHGNSSHRSARSTRAQPQERPSRATQKPAYLLYGRIRIWQVFHGVRHALRRGSAPLCNVAFRLCTTVSRPHGKARRRLDIRPGTDHFHCAENRRPKPPLYRGYHNGNLRLSAHSICPRRRPPLHRMQQAHRSTEPRTDGVTHSELTRGNASTRAGSRCPRA